MELLRHVVVLFHIIGFAVTFGAWAAEAAARRFRTTRLSLTAAGIAVLW
jgi:hypothetical protein